MIKKLPQSSGNRLGFAIEGRITEDEMQHLDREIQVALQQYETIRVLFNYERFDGMYANAIDETLDMLRFVNNIERLAVIAGRDLHLELDSASDSPIQFEIKHFAVDEEAQAWDWLES